MAKFKTSLVSKYKEDKKRQEEQQKLKDKHNIKDNNVVVVEKANMTKFTVKMLIRKTNRYNLFIDISRNRSYNINLS